MATIRILSIIFSIVTVITVVTVVLVAAPAHAAGDAERGRILATACLGCHGIEGYRNAYPSYRVPKLGGQQQEYIALGLNGYKSNNRSHPTMRAQTADLSDADIEDLAAYFSTLGELASGNAKSNASIERGRDMAAVCTACHGPDGVSAMPNWPTLAGQHQDYLREALTQYKLGSRTDPVMAGQVISLSDQDIEDLAAYYAAQPGLVAID